MSKDVIEVYTAKREDGFYVLVMTGWENYQSGPFTTEGEAEQEARSIGDKLASLMPNGRLLDS